MTNKRQCRRFTIAGATVYYKKKPKLWKKTVYSRDYYPVLNISRGGLLFLSNHKIEAGTSLTLKLNLPDSDSQPEIKAVLRWIELNPGKSYRYQNGVAFNAYGAGLQENPSDILLLLKQLESKTGIE